MAVGRWVSSARWEVGVEGVAGVAAHESQEVEVKELGGEALGGGNGAFGAGKGGESEGGFAIHGGGRDVGDGEGLVAGCVSFAEGS